MALAMLLAPVSSAKAFWPFSSSDSTITDSTPASPTVPSINDSIIIAYSVIPELTIDYTKTTKSGLAYIPLDGDGSVRGAGQCVLWVKYVTNTYYSGDAGSWSRYVNSHSAKVGDIVVLNTSKWGHIGVVITVDLKAGTITMRSRNYRGKYIVSDDVLQIDDVDIVGYIHKK